MDSLIDEFDFLVSEEVEKTYLEESQEYIERAKEFIKNIHSKTYQGIKSENIISCIKIGQTATMPWEHVSMILDVSKLRTIDGARLEQFDIPNFVEELSSIGESEVSFNESWRNNLKYIHIPASVAVIANNTFALYNKLSTVDFEDDSRLIQLGDNAFAGCKSLVTLDLRKCEYLDSLAENTFSISNKLTTLKVTDAIDKTSLQQAVKNSAIKNVVINNVKYTREQVLNDTEYNN